MRPVLAALVVLVMAGAIAGVGSGQAPAEREREPSPAQVQAARQRIAALAPQGRGLFADQGCERCHSLAAVGADGKLGPRLDTIDDDADDIAESIVEPRDDTADGYPERLMPGDYGQRMSDRRIRALAAFIAAASGAEDERDEHRSGRGERGDEEGSGRGRGRGRGRAPAPDDS